LHEWDAQPGDHEVVVRAYDGTGEIQTSKKASPFPSGSSGYDTVDISA
jgi:hypothetical protein